MTVCLSVSHVSMQFDECENECAVSECASDSPSVAPAAALARGHSLDMFMSLDPMQCCTGW
jgi:hypothetical protein